jgi:hypothetical protein
MFKVEFRNDTSKADTEIILKVVLGINSSKFTVKGYPTLTSKKGGKLDGYSGGLILILNSAKIF